MLSCSTCSCTAIPSFNVDNLQVFGKVILAGIPNILNQMASNLNDIPEASPVAVVFTWLQLLQRARAKLQMPCLRSEVC